MEAGDKLGIGGLDMDKTLSKKEAKGRGVNDPDFFSMNVKYIQVGIKQALIKAISFPIYSNPDLLGIRTTPLEIHCLEYFQQSHKDRGTVGSK